MNMPTSNSEKLTPEKRIALYGDVNSDSTFYSRADRASSAKVRDVGENIVSKSDLMGGVPLVARELIILYHLQGTNAVPKIDDEPELYGYPLTFEMEKINNGATIEDWLLAYSKNPELINIFPEILYNIRLSLAKIWAKGVIHGDLHLNNIVVGMKRGGEVMDPKIIDFGISIMNERKMQKIAKNLGISEAFTESEAAFQRQVTQRYESEEGAETEYFISQIDDFIRCPDIGKLLKKFRDNQF